MVPNNQPLFSIIIPTFNRPERLHSCLQSISDLDNASDEIQTLVVNDGSTLPYDNVIESFNDKLKLSYWEQHNQGPAAARNRGADHAEGGFLVFLDDDCTLPSDWLHKMQTNVHRDFVVGGHTINCLTDNVFSRASQALIDYLYGYYNSDTEQALFITSNNMIIPKQIYQQVGGFDLDFSDAAAEDRDFCDRLLYSGYAIKYRPEITIHHYHHMKLRNYVKQHYKYGYSARLFHRKRSNRNGNKLRIEPPHFYTDLLTFPLKNKLPRALTIASLLVLSQVANALGFFNAKLKTVTRFTR